MSDERAAKEPMFRDLTLTGEYADRVLLDEQDGLLYFVPPGERVPARRSDYLVGVGTAVLLIAAWIVLAIVAFVLHQVIDGFDGLTLGFTIPACVVVAFALIAPFLRRKHSAEGKFYDGMLGGQIIAMRPTDLSRTLAERADADQPGYYEQALSLARADALRQQAEQIRELRAASLVAGSHAGEIDGELEEYAGRLERAASDREQLVGEYLGEVSRG